jgi:hypothetical protein
LVTKRKNTSQEKERLWEKPKLKIIVEKVILKDSQIEDEGKGIVVYVSGYKKGEESPLMLLTEENNLTNELKVGGKKNKISIDLKETFEENIKVRSKKKISPKKIKSKEK